MVSPIVATEIGKRMGVVEEVEKRHNKDGHNLFMRVKVAIPIAKLIRREGFLVGLDGQKTWTTFKYERLPMFCHYCGLLGHGIKHCAIYFRLMKSGKEVRLQYGEWLKASRGRQRMERTKSGRGDTVPEKENIQSKVWRRLKKLIMQTLVQRRYVRKERAIIPVTLEKMGIVL